MDSTGKPSGPTHHRVIASCSEQKRACPRWQEPVTLGGGITMVNCPLGLSSYTSFRCTIQHTDSHDCELTTLAVLQCTDGCKQESVWHCKHPTRAYQCV